MLWSVVPLAMFLKFLSCANVLSVNAKLLFFALYRSFFQQYGLVLSKFKNVASVLFFPLFSVCSIFYVFSNFACFLQKANPAFFHNVCRTVRMAHNYLLFLFFLLFAHFGFGHLSFDYGRDVKGGAGSSCEQNFTSTSAYLSPSVSLHDLVSSSFHCRHHHHYSSLVPPPLSTSHNIQSESRQCEIQCIKLKLSAVNFAFLPR